jgi:hypothetical protein
MHVPFISGKPAPKYQAEVSFRAREACLDPEDDKTLYCKIQATQWRCAIEALRSRLSSVATNTDGQIANGWTMPVDEAVGQSARTQCFFPVIPSGSRKPAATSKPVG